MRYRGTLAVSLFVLSVFAGTAQAANDTKTEITQNANKNAPDQQELVTWGDILESKETTVSERNTGDIDSVREDRLKKWRDRQAHLWKSLSYDTFTINASAYTAAADECGKSNGITASGVKVLERRTLACPPQYPFGVKIEIEGRGVYVCEDRGGAIKGNHFDIYMETKIEAFAFGRRNLSAKVVE